MSTSLSFNLFGNVLHRKKTNQRRILDLQIIYDGALCDNGSHFVLTSSSNKDDRGIVELALYAIIFSFHDKFGSMEEDRDPKNSTSFLFSVRGISSFASSAEKRLFFDTFICILLSLHSVIWINTLTSEIFKYTVRVFKAGNLSFWNMKSF